MNYRLARSFLRRILPSFLICISTVGVFAAEPTKIESGRNVISWSSDDLAIRSDTGATVLSFRSVAAREWDGLSRDAKGQALEFEKSYRLLSAVGPFLSVEDGSYCDCGGAHPSATKQFRAIDLCRTRPLQPAAAKITDIFPEREVFAALMEDKAVRTALMETGAPTPNTLPALMDKLQFQSLAVGECSFSFGPDLLSSFAFHHVAGDKVAVRFSLSHAVEICRGELTQIGIVLPIPEQLREALQAASARETGLLMTDATALPKDSQVTYRFASRAGGERP